MIHRFPKSLLRAAVLAAALAAGGCGSTPPEAPPPPPPEAVALTIAPHDCLGTFGPTAAPLAAVLRERTALEGKGWARHLASEDDFQALKCLCIDLSVALDMEVMERSHQPTGIESPANLRADCILLRTLLQDDRNPPSGPPYHEFPEDRGWLRRPPLERAILDAEDLFYAAKKALDM